jgi:hypothetical protein|tara:strand:- start:309 stop:599 length:291 start_codon:yes stop_codon:yes gene_type:complete
MEKDGKKRRSSSMSSMEENELAKKDLLIIGDIIRGKNNINSEDEKIKRLFPDSEKREKVAEPNTIREQLIERGVSMGLTRDNVTDMLDKMLVDGNN